MGSLNAIPYWQVNVPEHERTEDCPDFLCNLSPKDVGIIGTPDSEYHVATWEEVRQIIRDNRLDAFRRVPSHLRRYLGYTSKLRQDYGSVMNFILTQRLHWDTPVVAKGKPFELEGDVKILQNDWPYGIDKRIVHLVVWTKFDLEEDPVTTDLTDKARAEIETYCQRKFGGKLSRDQVLVLAPPFLVASRLR